MNGVPRSLPTALLAAVLAGCSATLPTAPAEIAFQPATPVARTTAYTQPLQCLGQMLATYSDNQEPILVGVMTANDNTGANQFTSAEIPREFTLMVEAAVNSISPRIRLTNVDHDFQVREVSVGGRFARLAPQLLIKPGISEFDRGLTIKQSKKDLSGFFGKGKGATDFSGDRGQEDVTSRIAVDVMAYDYATMVSIPQVHASVGAEVGRKSDEAGWSLSIYGWGAGSSHVSKAIQGRHEALRMLTEYAMLQTLGRFLKLPYWRCVDGMPEDQSLRDTLSNAYAKLPPTARVAGVQELLQYHGFKDLKQSGTLDAATQQAVAKAALANPQLDADLARADLYYKLYVSIPVSNVPDHRGWRLIKPLQGAVPSSRAPAAIAPTKALTLALAAPPAARGRPVKLSLTALAETHAYCFLQEAHGAVQQFFPNRFVRQARLKPGQRIDLPGQMPFELVAHEQGQRETVACFASPRDIGAKLPGAGRDFEPLPVHSLDDVADVIAQLTGRAAEAARVDLQAPQ